MPPDHHVVSPRRGEVWRVAFEPVQRSETGKTRPAMVISDEKLGRLAVRLVVPITGWNDRYAIYPWMTRLAPGNGLSKESAADALQMRVSSLERFEEHLGTLPEEVVERIAASVAV